MKRIIFLGLLSCFLFQATAQNQIIQKDTIIVARDGTGDFRNLQEAFDQIRAFRPEPTVIFIKKGVYKEKLVLHAWLQNTTLTREYRDQTIITNNNNAKKNNMGTNKT